MIINKCYQNFPIDDDKVVIWSNFLKDIPFDKAQENLREHIRSSSFVPTPADIIRHDPNQFIDHERQRQETLDRFAEMDEWERKAIPCPEHLIPKLIGGDADE